MSEANARRCPVVGIGASAGGLEALTKFFSAMPVDSGRAFVVVQHLMPTHESRMAEIIAKHTAMRVVLADDGMPVTPNAVFTIPPGRVMRLRDGRFLLDKPSERHHVQTPIDHFLVSLAGDQGETAIAIILSGSSGTDGPRGVRAIHAAGGKCLAQDPETAQYPAMPQAAIDTGMVDAVLPVDRMPAALSAVGESGISATAEPAVGKTGAAEADLEGILELLRGRNHGDFRQYRRTMILRRIRRRMGQRNIGEMADYRKLLGENAAESASLANDILIGVSSFFRDPEAFEELRQEVIEPLVDSGPVRAWAPACATGEEAYSIAMLLLEAASATGRDPEIQVFATDVAEAALQTARAGEYPEDIAGQVSPERLDRFFTRQGSRYQVSKQLRDAVVFSRHNVLTDPPFSRLQLLSCRNLLIYLEPPAQRKVLDTFGFALTVGGCLFVGKSEGIHGLEEYFEPVSPKRRIYRLTKTVRKVLREHPFSAGEPPIRGTEAERGFLTAAFPLARVNLETILRHFDAGVVLVDAAGQIRHFHGPTEKYLGHPKGAASLNLLDLTEGVLSLKLRRALEQAGRQNEPVALMQTPLPREGTPLVNVTVTRAADAPETGKLFAVIFEDAQPPASPSAASTPSQDEPLVTQLETEVKALRREVRSNADEYEAASDDLRVANEEVMSMNEELQSANEELEASREELQSLNEELMTVNSQQNDTVAELTAANNDLSNLLGAAEIATVFLDEQLRVRRYTARATELFNLIPSDLSRPFEHITKNFAGDSLAADARHVLQNLAIVDRECRATNGLWYTVRLLPYRTLDQRVAGVVITFSDVTRLKEEEQRIQYQKAYSESIVETIRDPLVVLDRDLTVISANTAYHRKFQTTPEAVERHRFDDLSGGIWNIAELREQIEALSDKTASFEKFRVEREFGPIGRRIMLLNGRRIADSPETTRFVLLVIEDITDAEQRAVEIRRLAAQLVQSEQEERERIARMLHDDLQQLLVGAKFRLRAVRSQNQNLSDGDAVDEVEELLGQAIEASRTLTGELFPAIFHEAGLTAALPWIARQMKAKHGLEVDLDIRCEVARDPDGVAFLLFNAVRELLFNVAKHAKVSKASVLLERAREGEIRVVVADEGVGFEPGKILRSNSPATGLGLLGLRERLRYFGGRLEVESAPGRGARVTLTANVQQTTAGAGAVARDAIPAGVAGTPEGNAAPRREGRIRVLLVDDHAIVRQGIKGILEAEPDVEIVGEAADGAEALRLAHRFRPDVAVMDLNMPVMNGIDATRRIAAELPEIRIIGLSMYEEADQAQAMREAGAVDFLSKDGPAEKLLAAIRRHASA